ncbi:MAG TPA: hypothetical protein VGR56_07250 [Nitrososphaerales archaeon]|nr:hypothetical protein [Nitrososphaerales archaeon]
MGWGMKVALLIFALVAVGFGAWIISMLIFAYLILSSVFKKKREHGKNSGGQADSSHSVGTTKIVGGLFLVLGFVALFSGGTLSPVVLALVGFLLLFWPRIISRMPVRAKPVEDSVLLRGRPFLFRWFALAEAKISTRDIEGSLSGVNERLLVISNPTPRILLVFSTNAFSRGSAEGRLVKQVQSAARALVSLGVYLLPLDSAEAAAASELRSLRVALNSKDLHQVISTSNYGAAAVEARHGFVTSFELYTRPDQTQKAIPILSGANERSQGLFTLRELLHEALLKNGAPHPDNYTAFLSSMAATEGEILGQRLTQTGGQNGGVLLVASLGTPQVELTRAQLQAVARIYE